MVDKSLILKSINDAVSKCNSNGGNTRLNYKIRNTFKNFHHNTIGLKHEKAIITDKNGNEIWNMNGNKTNVPIWKDIDKLNELRKKYGKLHFDHNHPFDSDDEEPYFPNTLSVNDLKCMEYLSHDDSFNNGVEGVDYLFKSMTAESSNGSRTTILRKENFNMKENEDAYEKAIEHYEEYVTDTVQEKFFNTMYKDVNHEIHLFKQENNREPTNNEKKEIKNKIGWAYYEDYINGLKPIQKEFNECNMELIVEMVD